MPSPVRVMMGLGPRVGCAVSGCVGHGGHDGDCVGALQAGTTALMKAAQWGRDAVVRILVDAGAAKDLQDEVCWASIGS